MKRKLNIKLSDSGWKILDKLLMINPDQRWDSTKCLENHWFDEKPLPERKNFKVIKKKNLYFFHLRRSLLLKKNYDRSMVRNFKNIPLP